MVATDIFGRGIDIDRVNIVINYDMPDNSDTYLHRVKFNPEFSSFFSQVGRAGRFGTKGLAITFVSTKDEAEKKILDEVQARFEVNVQELPDQIDVTSYSNFLNTYNLNFLVST